MSEALDQDHFLHFGRLVAQHMLGRPVRLSWTGCEDSRYGKGTGRILQGQCYHDGDCDVIELDPGLVLNPERALHVLLHEVSHLKDHPELIADHAKVARATLEKRGRIEDYAPKAWREREDRAEGWTQHWERWAAKRCPEGGVVDKLLVLLEWPGGVERGSPRHKLLGAYDAWRDGYHDKSTEHKVTTALNQLWGDEPIVRAEDVALYKRTMALMGAKP